MNFLSQGVLSISLSYWTRYYWTNSPTKQPLLIEGHLICYLPGHSLYVRGGLVRILMVFWQHFIKYLVSSHMSPVCPMCCMLMNIKCLFKYKKWQNTLREIVDFMDNPALDSLKKHHRPVILLSTVWIDKNCVNKTFVRSIWVRTQDKYEHLTKWKWFV